ncbi:LuxR C-terminal-related transcriptional regulator [Ideonella sp. DXS29W]|uniref:LuxR C-terminal-related transcriptional regulator n=1 Tax=Ideonella lacteola TaxID=2984193 RepID=A0ABU9BWD5_9BURK
MNPDDLMKLGQSKNIQELIRGLEKATSSLDFRYFTSNFVIRPPGELPRFKVLDNSPVEFEAGKDYETAMVDPVLKKLSSSPFLFQYDQDFYTNAGYGHLWEVAAVHGYKTGLCVAIEINQTTRFLFGLDRCFDLPTSDASRTSLYSSFINLALHTSFAARALMLPSTPISEPPRLAPREQLVLKMSSNGLTAARIASKLGIQRSTVDQYVQSAMAKLGASNKVHAVHIAVQLNLLD